MIALGDARARLALENRGDWSRDRVGRQSSLLAGIGDDEEKRQRDEHGGRQEGKKQVDAISQGEDMRKMEEENKGENKAGREPEKTENPTRDTKARRSDEEEESRGPRGSYHLGGGEEPSRKEDTT
ncbi:hypothetical protein NDU88_008917 [Pleurodeles waltl]|uniref:Uncharacterized protein n=1 Tax=Pleurodeles waltl TaxID=8319 RepID=A0AAV7QW14_PLEWA|nr:hypothetical protein NDU88_008917 [Pleurodeles waltl]